MERMILLKDKILLDTDLKIILLDYQNNEQCKNFFLYSSN